jgi:hypothetical protein
MRVLLWHVHGSWTTAFVQGRHEYVLPVQPDRGPDGRGRASTWDWPGSVVECSPEELADEPVDLIVLQRPHEVQLAEQWTRRRPGVDVPAVYVEHNAPEAHAVNSRHPLADRADVPLVHVTHFNRLYWDSGRAPTTVIEHGIVDPGEQYTGELAHLAAVINEPGRRGRTVGTDLLAGFAALAPLDLFGMTDGELRMPGVRQQGDLPQREMHTELARRRVYVHTARWTSLGLSLIEAMHLAMPVVAVAATEAVDAVPPTVGVISTDPARLHAAVREHLADVELARLTGKAARAHALKHFGLARFLADWDRTMQEVAR